MAIRPAIGSMSLGIFAFTLLGIPLAITMKRGDKTSGFLIATIVLSVYWGLMIAMMALAKTGTVPPILGIHFPNVLLFGAGLILLRRVLKA